MKLTINISEDAELRVFIKRLVKEQIQSVVREEAASMMQEAVNARVTSLAVSSNELQKALTKLFDSPTRMLLKELLVDKVNSVTDVRLEDIVREKVRGYTTDTVRALVTEKVGEILSKSAIQVSLDKA